MRDLENELRATLERKADEAISPTRLEMPERVSGRVRRRQARTVMFASVTLAALISVSVLASRAFVSPEIGGDLLAPARPTFTVFDPPIEVGPRHFRLASGETNGESWNLFALWEEREQRVALEVTSGGHTSGAAGFTVPEAENIETSSAWVGTTASQQVIFGAVVPEAAGVHVESKSGGRTPGVVMSLPRSLGEDFKVIFAEVSGGLVGDIIITDVGGREIARAQLAPAPPPFPPPIPTPLQTPPLRPGEPIHLLDHFGNAVGVVPSEQAFGDPSAWAAPGLQVPEVTVEEIRATAGVSLKEIWTAVLSWWERRPGPAAPDSAFLEWWASYPIGTEPVPEIAEITPQG